MKNGIMKLLRQTQFEKPAMNLFSQIGRAGVLMLLATAPAAVAQSYNFTFTGQDGINALGTITISGGVAQSGSISVMNVPLEAPPYTPLTTAAGGLLPASGPTSAGNHNGDVISYDNVANIANDPVFDSAYGLGFGSGQYGPAQYNTLINLWGNSPGSYGMFIGEAQLDGDGNVIGNAQWVYVYNEPGIVTFSPVPEPSADALMILGALTVGFVAMRRRLAAA